MFIRKLKNRSGSICVQIISKDCGKYEVIKTIGSTDDEHILKELFQQAHDELTKLTRQNKIDFSFSEDEIFLKNLKENFRRMVLIGPELVLGKIFDEIGYRKIPDALFRHLVITRLVCPGSKLKTVDYLIRHQGIYTHEDRIYRYMDCFNANHTQTVIDITYRHTKEILNNKITVAFYDITTLYFETSQEDDLRKLGFSKDGKAQNPQILLALLVSVDGHPLAFEIFEGDKFEGHTLIPVIQTFKKKYQLPELIVVADAGLLSADNIKELITLHYPFILGARLKNETNVLKEQILRYSFTDGKTITIQKENNIRLLVNYSVKRAKKDAHTRARGLEQLEKKIKSGKLTKEHINNRGYNKYLRIKNEVAVEIDYQAYQEDNKWNGLKGYVTNCSLSETEIMDNYKHLWTIEKAFRISKTDLRIRPIYHRLERRIKTHICLAFCSYKIYKELERVLKTNKSSFTVEQILRIIKTIHQAQVILPQSKKEVQLLLPLDDEQRQVLRLFDIPF